MSRYSNDTAPIPFPSPTRRRELINTGDDTPLVVTYDPPPRSPRITLAGDPRPIPSKLRIFFAHTTSEKTDIVASPPEQPSETDIHNRHGRPPQYDIENDIDPKRCDLISLNQLARILANAKIHRICGPATERNISLVILMLGTGFAATDLSLLAPIHVQSRHIFQPSTFSRARFGRSIARNCLSDLALDYFHGPTTIPLDEACNRDGTHSDHHMRYVRRTYVAVSPPTRPDHQPYYPMTPRHIQRVITETAAPFTPVHIKRLYRQLRDDPDQFLSDFERNHHDILARNPQPATAFPYTRRVIRKSTADRHTVDRALATTQAILSDILTEE